MIELSIVLPAKNESKSIRKCIDEIVSFCLVHDIDYELIIINDHSKDKTAQIVKGIARNNSRIVLLYTKQQSGYGAALQKGIHAASKAYTLIMDADLQYDIADLEQFLPFIPAHRGVIGYRTKLAYSWENIVKYRLYQICVRGIFGIPYKDIDCNFKLFKTEIIKTCKITSPNGLATIELLVSLYRRKIICKEVPISHYYRKFNDHRLPVSADLTRVLGLFKLKFKII